jgi:hypothetical protein
MEVVERNALGGRGGGSGNSKPGSAPAQDTHRRTYGRSTCEGSETDPGGKEGQSVLWESQ